MRRHAARVQEFGAGAQGASKLARSVSKIAGVFGRSETFVKKLLSPNGVNCCVYRECAKAVSSSSFLQPMEITSVATDASASNYRSRLIMCVHRQQHQHA